MASSPPSASTPEPLVGAIPEGWEYEYLGEVCRRTGGDVQTGPFGSQLHASDYVSNGVPSIMPQNIGDNRVVADGIARITEGDAERLSRYRVCTGDIVYSRRGDVERRALIGVNENGWVCGTGCLRIRFGAEINPIYASYYLGDPRVREWIVRHAHGATMPNLNTSILSALPFVVPTEDDQNEIARFLGALDSRIELNRSMNETLEAIAQAIFKSWFVDFDPVKAKAEGREPEGMDAATAALFASTFEDPELGTIPQGWSRVSLYEIADFSNGAAFKDSHFSDSGEGLPVIKIAELKSGISANTKFTTSQLNDRFRIVKNEILFSWSGNPDTSIDTFIWPGSDAWLNQHIFRVRENGAFSRTFVFCQLRFLKPVFTSLASNKQTTGLGHVTVADMKRIFIVRPSNEVLNKFEELVGPLMQRIEVNQQSAIALTDLRDTLLPKLMSAQIRVLKAEALVTA